MCRLIRPCSRCCDPDHCHPHSESIILHNFFAFFSLSLPLVCDQSTFVISFFLKKTHCDSHENRAITHMFGQKFEQTQSKDFSG